ncbi:MAG TPA: DinB family protein [Bryobacteraceae bacterium]|nr:DinB family protein [Bryobacteraceae bacterium]
MSNYTEPLEQFRQGSSVLETALRGASPEETSFVSAPGKWTIRQLVRHLADTEIVVGMRMRQIVAEDKPTLIPFDQEKWAARLGYENTDAFDSLGRFQSLRDDTARILEALPAEAFDRVGVHPERGEKSLLEWLRVFGKHVFTHAEQIRGIREAWKNR